MSRRDSIKINLQEIECKVGNWIKLVQDTVQWQAFC
jgi:hypothetical protein